jgi:transcriptional regulator with XRE-family HTH domain
MNDSCLDISSLRKKHRLSQMQLAEIANVSQATVSRIESGESTPSLQFLSNVARHLGIPLRELVPEQQLRALLGQDELSQFYAFCPNPFCDRNTYLRKDGLDYIRWASGQTYPSDSFDEINYCTRCGTSLAKECPSCGRRLEEGGTSFCITCGKEITDRPTREEWQQIHGRLDKQAEASRDEEVPF